METTFLHSTYITLRRYYSLAVARLLRRWRSRWSSRSSSESCALAATLRCVCLEDSACRFCELDLYVRSRSSGISWICCSRNLCWNLVFRWCVGPLLLCPSDRVVPSDPMSCCVPISSSIFHDRSTRSMVSSILHLLSSSLFGIRPGAYVRWSVPCALESSIFLDRSPGSMISSVSRLLSSSLFGIRPGDLFYFIEILTKGKKYNNTLLFWYTLFSLFTLYLLVDF